MKEKAAVRSIIAFQQHGGNGEMPDRRLAIGVVESGEKVVVEFPLNRDTVKVKTFDSHCTFDVP